MLIPRNPPESSASSTRTFGMLSTFPPTACGIATFAAALSAGLVAHGSEVDVVRCGSAPLLEDALVVTALDDGLAADVARCADALNRMDVVIVQHEYGIYGGADGETVLRVLALIKAPVVLVAHTVVSEPTRGQRSVLERACSLASFVVVMTETARQRLLVGYTVAPDKVVVIPHGATTPAATPASDPPERDGGGDAIGPRVLTWGLLGPGKGIEWAIDAFAMLDDLVPAPVYVIAGATHPKVVEDAGETYREMLVERAARSGAGERIRFDDSYRDLESLTQLISSADLVLLPYDSVDQVTSGVLVDAVAAGRAVVSTAFPHAVELLATGAGIVVPQRDAAALAGAIRSVLTDRARSSAMSAEARRLAPELSWVAVAGRYDDLAEQLLDSALFDETVSS